MKIKFKFNKNQRGSLSRMSLSRRGLCPEGRGCVCPEGIPPRWTDRQLWKHYFPLQSVMIQILHETLIHKNNIITACDTFIFPCVYLPTDVIVQCLSCINVGCCLGAQKRILITNRRLLFEVMWGRRRYRSRVKRPRLLLNYDKEFHFCW